MSVAVWIAVAVAVVIACGPITYGGTRKVDDKALARYVGKIGLPLPDVLRGPVILRITHQERLMAWCGIAGIAVGVLLSVLLQATGANSVLGPNGDLAGFVVMMLTAIGMSIGAVVAAAGRGAELNPSAPRLAHGTQTSLTDYLHRTELVALLGGAVVTMLAGVLALLLSPEAPPVVVVVAIGIAVVGTTTVLVVLRHVARRPQRAGSELELAWDDVMRAAGLRQLLVTGLVLNLAGVIVIVVVGALNVVAPLPVVVVLGMLGLVQVAVGFGVPLPFWVGRLHNYPVRRLWPSGIAGVAPC